MQHPTSEMSVALVGSGTLAASDPAPPEYVVPNSDFQTS